MESGGTLSERVLIVLVEWGAGEAQVLCSSIEKNLDFVDENGTFRHWRTNHISQENRTVKVMDRHMFMEKRISCSYS